MRWRVHAPSHRRVRGSPRLTRQSSTVSIKLSNWAGCMFPLHPFGSAALVTQHWYLLCDSLAWRTSVLEKACRQHYRQYERHMTNPKMMGGVCTRCTLRSRAGLMFPASTTCIATLLPPAAPEYSAGASIRPSRCCTDASWKYEARHYCTLETADESVVVVVILTI